ncbi:hypothetical protein PHYC_00632 [Phycisphaerales bacterium]|nr:hypothetical protein PHYC_00632 [Phycisphaerales bacterium]
MGKARPIVAVVAGFLAYGAFTYAGTLAAFFTLGPEYEFQPGTYRLSALWIALGLILNVAGALIGGAVCRGIARGPLPVVLFARIVLAISVFGSLPSLVRDRGNHGPRVGEIGFFAANKATVPPWWLTFVSIPVGFVGITLGGRAPFRGPWRESGQTPPPGLRPT